MDTEINIKKSLTKIGSNENGWRKTLMTAEGSFSRDLARKNLDRLEEERQSLLSQLTSLAERRQDVMNNAFANGAVTDNIRDGICEQLMAEGWLVRAAVVMNGDVKSPERVYLLTDKANSDWHDTDVH
jgi:hypothetical protein